MKSYEIVSSHTPVVSLRYDIAGGVDVLLDDWVYVHINYDHRYTFNSARATLAEHIAQYLRNGPAVIHAIVKE